MLSISVNLDKWNVALAEVKEKFEQVYAVSVSTCWFFLRDVFPEPFFPSLFFAVVFKNSQSTATTNLSQNFPKPLPNLDNLSENPLKFSSIGISQNTRDFYPVPLKIRRKSSNARGTITYQNA